MPRSYAVMGGYPDFKVSHYKKLSKARKYAKKINGTLLKKTKLKKPILYTKRASTLPLEEVKHFLKLQVPATRLFLSGNKKSLEREFKNFQRKRLEYIRNFYPEVYEEYKRKKGNLSDLIKKRIYGQRQRKPTLSFRKDKKGFILSLQYKGKVKHRR